MNNLILSPGIYTPKVNFIFETGILEVSGNSTPEDSYHFFQPILNWIEMYKKNPAPSTSLIFRMEYFNTSSTVFILRLIKGIGQLKEEGKIVNIRWYHGKDDEDLIEAGRDFGILAKTTIDFFEV